MSTKIQINKIQTKNGHKTRLLSKYYEPLVWCINCHFLETMCKFFGNFLVVDNYLLIR